MKKLIGVAILLCFFSCLTLAQETPKPEVFGGYQFTTMNPSWNASGWNGQANFYVTRWLGVTGDFSGAYSSGEHFHTYTFGPVVSTHKGSLSPFVHGLFGGAHASAAGVGINASQTNFKRTRSIAEKAGAILEFSFSGPQVSLVGVKNKEGGKADVYIDDVLQATIDTASPARLWD